MEQFDNVFIYLPTYRVILCRQCGYAVEPSQARGHITKRHRKTSAEECQAIITFIQQIEEVAWQKDDVQYPEPESRPIDGLPVYKDGYCCRATSAEDDERCRFVCQTSQTIQKHCREQHQWKNQQGRGGHIFNRRKQPANRLWEDGCVYQRFFVQGPWKRYFEVQRSNTMQQQQQQSNSIVERGLHTYEMMQQAIQQAREARTIQPNTSRSVVERWVHFTRWAVHLQGFRSEELIEHIRDPIEGQQSDSSSQGSSSQGSSSQDSQQSDSTEYENGLAIAVRAVRRLIRIAYASSRAEKMGDSALRYVNRRETGEKNNEKPFYGYHKVNTIRKYSRVWVRVFCYLWRTHEMTTNRPEYKLTGRQLHCLQQVKQIANREHPHRHQTPLEQAILEFWIAMFDHELNDDNHENGVISGLAILGIDPIGGGWKSATMYTPTLSAIVTTMQAFVAYRALRQFQREVEHLRERQGYSEQEAREIAGSIFHRVREMVDKFMTLTSHGGQPTPMNHVLHARTYGLKIRFTTAAEGMVCWRGNEIMAGPVNFTMNQLRTAVHGLQQTTWIRLLQEMLLLDVDSDGRVRQGTTDIAAQLDLPSLYDNPREMSPRWNFIQDPRNACLKDGHIWLFKRVLEEIPLQKRFIRQDSHQGNEDGPSEDTTLQLNQTTVDDYFRSLRSFKEQLFVLVHLTGGAPARGTEITSIQHRNGVNAARGVFIENGLVSFVTSYHKGYSKSQDVKLIYRYVPAEVSKIVVYYLWLVQPFVEILQSMALGAREFGDFIWEPEFEDVFGEDEDREQEGDEEEEEGGDDDDDDDNDNDDKDDDIRDDGSQQQQQQQQQQVVPPKNADGFWGTDRVRRVMQQETLARLGVRIPTIMWRHLYPAIQERHTSNRAVIETIDNIYRGQPEVGAQDETRAKQAGHSRRTETMIYGRLLMESPFHTVAERDKFRRVSRDWHRFLEFPSGWQDDEIEAVTKVKMEAEQKEEEYQRWQLLKRADLRTALKQIAGPQAEFGGVQREGLTAIVQGRSPILIVMGTGGGKSLFFMIPASIGSDGVTVVVVALISLRQDLRRRCDDAGIRCVEWDGMQPDFQASIVLVTPESAVSESFSRFMDVKRAMRQLERVVIDECHVVLDSTNKWRPDMLRLKEMLAKGVQMVYLTATLPAREMGRFFEIMGLREEELTQIRSATTRKNVEYRVEEYEARQETETIQELVQRKQEEYPQPGQIIIYCETINKAKSLAKALDCPVYHREAGTDKEKKKILQDLTAGKKRVFTATNALGLGIDAPTIRVVIHVGIRQKLRDYAQESGRAGRDGQKSEAIIMRGFWYNQQGQKKMMPFGREVQEEMKKFVEGERCRRVVLDEYMDGRWDRRGCEMGEERCDVCQGKPRGTKRRRIRVGFPAEEEGEEGEEGVQGRRFSNEEESMPGSPALSIRQSRGEEVIRVRQEEERIQFERQNRQNRAIQQRVYEDRCQQGQKLQALREKMEVWGYGCVICQAKGRGGGRGGGGGLTAQNWRNCPDCSEDDDVDIGEFQRVFDMIREGFRFEDYSGCNKCGLPFDICGRWKADERAGRYGRYVLDPGKWCRFRWQELHAAVAALCNFGSNEVQQWVVEQVEEAWKGGQEADTMTKIRKWLSSRIKWGDIESNQMCEILLRWG